MSTKKQSKKAAAARRRHTEYVGIKGRRHQAVVKNVLAIARSGDLPCGDDELISLLEKHEETPQEGLKQDLQKALKILRNAEVAAAQDMLQATQDLVTATKWAQEARDQASKREIHPSPLE